ncbi:hypothetical protein AVEN_117205-1 [Araneus ventricosus]|uniref:Uncharacterized protein n=1 Tax=Araneus ventricosus TaxID=182803 RepID=A0A4Y2AZI6_ARAVE|nr:hypothetical protein AVEN_117205-1 [Araneus ventricosus]
MAHSLGNRHQLDFDAFGQLRAATSTPMRGEVLDEQSLRKQGKAHLLGSPPDAGELPVEAPHLSGLPGAIRQPDQTFGGCLARFAWRPITPESSAAKCNPLPHPSCAFSLP